MNWPLINEIHQRALSGVMTSREATDEISQIWYLIFYHIDRKENYIKTPSPEYSDWQLEHYRLLEICQDIYKVNDTTEHWFNGWIKSMPTELKVSEIIKKAEKQRLLEESKPT